MAVHPAKRLWNSRFILLASGNFFMAIGFYFLIPTLPVYVVDVLDAAPGEAGLVLAIYTVSALLIRPFAGIALDTWGRKWLYIVSFAVFTATTAFYPLMGSFILLLLLRFFHGFSWGTTTTAGMTLAVDVIPPAKRGRGIGYFGISFTLSMAIAPFLALLILEAMGYLSMFLFATLFSAIGLILILCIRYPVFFKPAKNPKWRLSRFIEPHGIPVSIPLALFGTTYGGVFSFIALFNTDLGFDLAGTYFLILAAGVTLSRLFSGQIMDRYGPTHLMVGGFILNIVGFGILGGITTIYGFLISAFLIGIGAGILIPTLQAMGNNLVPVERRGAINATLITAFDLGIGVGSLGLGYLAEMVGFDGMYLICTLILVLALGYYLIHTNRFYLSGHQEILSRETARQGVAETPPP